MYSRRQWDTPENKACMIIEECAKERVTRMERIRFFIGIDGCNVIASPPSTRIHPHLCSGILDTRHM